MTERRSSVALRSSIHKFGAPHLQHRPRSAERLHDTHSIEDQHDDHDHENDHHDGHDMIGNRQRLASDSSMSKVIMGIRRVNSDPFENAGGEEEQDFDEEQQIPTKKQGSNRRRGSIYEEEHQSLPTFNRFPFGETKNQNCWSESPPTSFQVRGSKYLNDKKKITNHEFLLQARGCDLFITHDPNTIDMSRLKGALGGNFRKKPSFVVRFVFPWGLLIQYFEIPSKFVPFMCPVDKVNTTNNDCNGGTTYNTLIDETFTNNNAEKTFAKWLQGDTEYKNERLKLISYVPDGPWMVPNMVTGRPAIIGKKLPVSYKYVPKATSGSHMEPFLLCDLDIDSCKPAAKRIVNVCRRYMSKLTVDIGFVIEGKCEEELPEQMLGSIRIHEADPMRSPSI